MSFFNDLGKKISQTSQSAVNKTKAMTETSKLNSAINGNMKRIDLAYKEIGRFYCERHMNNPEPEIAEQVKLVAQLNAKIEELQAEIRKINGYINCPNCGQFIKEGDAFCTNCGTRFSQPQETVCPNCGYPAKTGAVFCTRCGSPLNNMPTQEENTQPQYGQPQNMYGRGYPETMADSERMNSERMNNAGAQNYREPADFGNPVREWQDIKPKAGIPDLQAEKAKTDPDVKICPSCGYECKKESEFCFRCGEKL